MCPQQGWLALERAEVDPWNHRKWWSKFKLHRLQRSVLSVRHRRGLLWKFHHHSPAAVLRRLLGLLYQRRLFHLISTSSNVSSLPYHSLRKNVWDLSHPSTYRIGTSSFLFFTLSHSHSSGETPLKKAVKDGNTSHVVELIRLGAGSWYWVFHISRLWLKMWILGTLLAGHHYMKCGNFRSPVFCSG